MIDYRHLEDLYKLKAFFDFFLDPKKLAQVQKDLTAKLEELDTKLGVVKSLDDVKKYESASNSAIDKKSAQINDEAVKLKAAQAAFEQKVVDITAQLRKDQAAVINRQAALSEQATAQTTRAAELNDKAVALNKAQQSLDEQQAKLAIDQRELADKAAKLKALMG